MGRDYPGQQGRAEAIAADWHGGGGSDLKKGYPWGFIGRECGEDGSGPRTAFAKAPVWSVLEQHQTSPGAALTHYVCTLDAWLRGSGFPLISETPLTSPT